MFIKITEIAGVYMLPYAHNEETLKPSPSFWEVRLNLNTVRRIFEGELEKGIHYDVNSDILGDVAVDIPAGSKFIDFDTGMEYDEKDPERGSFRLCFFTKGSNKIKAEYDRIMKIITDNTF